jgi:hypothetical protein
MLRWRVIFHINTRRLASLKSGAGEESRTLDLNLGKVALYQLSYSRIGVLLLTTCCAGPSGAGEESRTLDLNLGKVALYQLSYSRIGVQLFTVKHWSGRRVSNSRPQPWQGCALPTELLPHGVLLFTAPTAHRPSLDWSGRRVSNSRPQPWQGCALPTELLPHFTATLQETHSTPSPHKACKLWSGRRVSNSRPQPWQGCALPTELLPLRFV